MTREDETRFPTSLSQARAKADAEEKAFEAAATSPKQGEVQFTLLLMF